MAMFRSLNFIPRSRPAIRGSYSRKGTRNARSSLARRPLFLPIFHAIACPCNFRRRTGASRRTSFRRHRRRQAVGDGRRQTKSLKHPRVSSGWRWNDQRQPGEHKSDMEGRSGWDLHKAAAGGGRKMPSTDADQSRHRSVAERQDRLGAQAMKHTEAIRILVLSPKGAYTRLVSRGFWYSFSFQKHRYEIRITTS
ncbi:hypothetical protein PMI11_03684 [Rhizobium sp. CF142]|nr:hypothetical protein PMI11_03684 [Rhizobium sp. CF142]